jgi:23S rRNA (pseudouridine1915-N3)-methyltransferase
MHKIKVLSIGKNKESWLLDAITLYTIRLKGSIELIQEYYRTEEALFNTASKGLFFCLDPDGKTLDSPSFSCFLFTELEKNGCRLNFVIGGAEGLSQKTKEKAKGLISLSKLTFTHQIARLILIEQIYRATEIAKGSPYHK